MIRQTRFAKSANLQLYRRKYTELDVERLNKEGIRREDLLLTLHDPRAVLVARKIDSCLLCKRPRVNESGLCESCYGSLDGAELTLAVRWLAGVGP